MKASAAAVNAPRRAWRDNRKLDQCLSFWSVPLFYTLFGLVFVPLSWMMPPRSPAASPAQVVDFMQSPNLLVACVILVLSCGLAPVSNAVYLAQMKRMTVSPALRLMFIAGSIVGAVAGMLVPLFCFGLGAFRSGYSPAVLQLLYDFGYLAFIGSLGCFCVMWMALGLAIILDEKRILPKWLGYYTVWQFVSELMAAPVWISKSALFGWNGLMTFWVAMLVYVPWQFIVYVCIYRAIRSQRNDELENAAHLPVGVASGSAS